MYVVECEFCRSIVEVDSVWFTRAGAEKYIKFLPNRPYYTYEVREFEVQTYEEVD